MRLLTFLALGMLAAGLFMSAVGTAMLLATQLTMIGLVLLAIVGLLRWTGEDPEDR